MIDPKLVGINIKKIRTNNNLTQEDFGKIIGLTRQSVSSIEKGVSQPSLQVLDIISKEFKIPVDFILYGDKVRFYKETKYKKVIILSILVAFILLFLIGMITFSLFNPLVYNGNSSPAYWYLGYTLESCVFSIFFYFLLLFLIFITILVLIEVVKIKRKKNIDSGA